MNQIIIKMGLVLVLCLTTIWAQTAWLLGLFSNNPISDSLVVVMVLISGGLLFCLLIRFFSQFFTNKNLVIPSWLKAMTQHLATKLDMPEAKVHILSTTGLNAFAIDNLTRHGHVLLHQQVLTSLTHDEVEAILAHEICHIEKGHAGILTFMQGVMLPITLPLALLINSMFSRFFGSSSFKTKLLRTNSLLSFICFPLTSIVLLLFSRYWEYEADACASSLVGKEQYQHALRC